MKVECASESEDSNGLQYDLLWLTVLRKTHDLLVTVNRRVFMPDAHTLSVNERDIEETSQLLSANGGLDLKVPSLSVSDSQISANVSGNLQTDKLLAMLRLSHIWTKPYAAQGWPSNSVTISSQFVSGEKQIISDDVHNSKVNIKDTNEIDIDDI